MLNRDTLLIALTALAALLAFLKGSPAPSEWSYNDWLTAASLGLAWVSGNIVPRLGVTMTARDQKARAKARSTTHVSLKGRR